MERQRGIKIVSSNQDLNEQLKKGDFPSVLDMFSESSARYRNHKNPHELSNEGKLFYEGAKWCRDECNSKISQLQKERERLIRDVALKFWYHWWNSPGQNTEQGFDDWWKENKKELIQTK